MDALNNMVHQISSTCYIHKPLRGSRSFRVLKLSPKTADQSVQVQLQDVSLDDPIKFEALSYAWGSDQRVSAINCGSKIMQIPKSAFEALCQLQQKEIRVLWIDAICIDQDCLLERNHQVNLMADIYTKAATVLVYLGSHYKLPYLLNYMAEDMARMSRRWNTETKRSTEADFSITQLIEDVGHQPDRILNFREFSQRAYFHRMWPLQEIALARKCVVLGGEDQQDFDIQVLFRSIRALEHSVLGFSNSPPLRLAEELWSSFRYLYEDKAEVVNRPKQVWTSFRRIFDGAKLSKQNGSTSPGQVRTDDNQQFRNVSRLLLEARCHQSGEPKDKIFALYGMLSLARVALSPPDYAKSILQVYGEATVCAIDNDKSLLLLAGLNGAPSQYDLPSWVLDCSDSNAIAEVAVWGKATAARSSPTKYTMDQAVWSLTLYGYVIGAVESCYHQFSDSSVLHDDEVMRREIHSLIGVHFSEEGVLGFLESACLNSWQSLHSTYPSLRGLLRRWLLDPPAIDPATGWMRRDPNLSRWIKRDILKIPAILRKLLDRKVLFRTQHDRLGLASKYIQTGDQIALFSGCNLPMVIRPSGKNWKIVAPTFVNGIMDGALWDDTNLQSFTFF